jgi:hypothetical protein
LDPVVFYVASALQWLAILAVGVLTFGAFHEIGRLKATLRDIDARSLLPSPTSLHNGDRLPAALGFVPPPRAFVLLVQHGCSGCVDLCRKMEGIDIKNWSLAVVVCGKRPRKGSPATVVPPSGAAVMFDEQRIWLRELGVKGTPTALAFVGGRLVDQVAAPNVAWFQSLPQQRIERGEEVLGRATLTASPGSRG